MTGTTPAGPARESDGASLLHVRFDAQAARTPERIALRDSQGTATYRELQAESDRVAQSLRARGIGSGAAVGLHMDRSISYVAAVLGILKSNAAVVPLPPAYPATRLREILSFARLDAVIAGETQLPAVEGTRILALSELREGAEGAAPAATADPHQAAFVLCSSGSTGRPKMIVRSHRSFFHRLEWTWTAWPFAGGESCVQKSHMTTTHSIYELFEPLLAGVPAHIVPDEAVRDLEGFWEFIRKHGVTRLLIVPSLLQVSLDMPGFRAPPFRQVVLMGEYVQSRLAGRAIAAFPASTALYSIYGSTEASSTLVCDLRESWREGAELPLGKPISEDVRPQVLGPDLAPVAAGESGLLYMSGSAIFTEYFRSPELTAAAFAVAPGSGELLFNTQDQVRRTAGGAIEFVGRVDHTVKVRGFRVDLGEVEKAILDQPGVRHAVVMLGGAASENPPLVAFYAPAVDRDELFARLRERLAPYMVPSVLTGLSSFPLTASGKVDRMRLLEVHRSRAPVAGGPGDFTPTESRVQEAWGKVLKHGNAGPASNFFEVGGTSLSVFTVVNLLREAFGLDRAQLADHAVYEHPTLRELARYIDDARRGEVGASPAKAAVAVTLKQGDPTLSPLFVVASSGGTLGAYDRLSKILKTNRAIVGLRDPFVWGGRDPAMGFQEWISIYLSAMQERQPAGPYYVCAFSSAGAFGYEIARRLQKAGHDVAELVLIDPVGIGGKIEGSFGSRVFEAMFRSWRAKYLVRILGLWRHVSGHGRREGARAGGAEFSMSGEEFQRRVAAIRKDKTCMKDLSSLFELNSGQPFTMTDEDFAGLAPERYLAAFLGKVSSVTPDVDQATVERILIQYYGLQIPATHRYRLTNYEGSVTVYEPASPNVGLLEAYFRPHMRNLRMRTLPVGEPTERAEIACRNLSRSLRTHYRSMRDETFVRELAAAMEPTLR
jgi:enterobactin synthetase component F